jgi:hypothetical protein
MGFVKLSTSYYTCNGCSHTELTVLTYSQVLKLRSSISACRVVFCCQPIATTARRKAASRKATHPINDQRPRQSDKATT